MEGRGDSKEREDTTVDSDVPTADTSLQPVVETPRDPGVHSRPATDVSHDGHLPAARASQQMLCHVWSAPGGQETVVREARETGLGALHQRTPLLRHPAPLWTRNGSERWAKSQRSAGHRAEGRHPGGAPNLPGHPPWQPTATTVSFKDTK